MNNYDRDIEEVCRECGIERISKNIDGEQPLFTIKRIMVSMKV